MSAANTDEHEATGATKLAQPRLHRGPAHRLLHGERGDEDEAEEGAEHHQVDRVRGLTGEQHHAHRGEGVRDFAGHRVEQRRGEQQPPECDRESSGEEWRPTGHVHSVHVHREDNGESHRERQRVDDEIDRRSTRSCHVREAESSRHARTREPDSQGVPQEPGVCVHDGQQAAGWDRPGRMPERG